MLSSLTIKDEKNLRFPNIIDSNKSLNKPLIEINVYRYEIESPKYQEEDMVVLMDIGNLTLNWHPITINRMIKFFRYFKPNEQVIQEEKERIER